MNAHQALGSSIDSNREPIRTVRPLDAAAECGMNLEGYRTTCTMPSS
jgi:hypothetical protein